MNKLFGIILLLCLISCQSNSDENKENTSHEIVTDVHSYANFNAIQAKHLSLQLAVDFHNRILKGAATWDIQQLEADSVFILDIDDLQIDSIKLNDGTKTTFEIGTHEAYKGQPLSIRITPATTKVTIYYRTIYSDTDTFSAIQWLEPSQTKDNKAPFLYTQSEPNLARTWIPSQDAPAIKITYDATITVDTGLMALMSAENPKQQQPDGVYRFKMNQPIPSYLIALAVGHVAFQAIDEKTGVYAEPSLVQAAAAEFDELPKMLSVAEQLCGSYDWERYDVIVLPSGFPIGGMENPRLTFVTPTILAGDKSLVSLIAHELAHSWSGNLVTNATWNDLWLNEGFTVYFERRIIEALRGKDYAAMLWDLGAGDLEASLKHFAQDAALTQLKLDLQHRDPGLSLSDIPYEKGSLMLLKIEQVVGRDNFDAFIKAYLQQYRFKSLTTEAFLQYIDKELFSKNPTWKEAIDLTSWIYKPGIPANRPLIHNPKFQAVDSMYAAYIIGKDMAVLHTNEWSTHEWLHFLRRFDQQITAADMAALDARYKLSTTSNSEIACIWYVQAIKRNYTPAYEPMQAFLRYTGRQKFLEPIYTAMMENKQTQAKARHIFDLYKLNYHPIARQNIQGIIQMNNL